MDDETATRDNKVLPCPVCGSALNVEWLEVDDEQGHDEVFVFGCPKSDFHRAATRAQLLEVAASALVATVRKTWVKDCSG